MRTEERKTRYFVTQDNVRPFLNVGPTECTVGVNKKGTNTTHNTQSLPDGLYIASVDSIGCGP